MRENEFGSFYELASSIKELCMWTQVSTYVRGGKRPGAQQRLLKAAGAMRTLQGLVIDE